MTDKIIRIRLDANQANRDINQLDGNMRRAGGAADGLQTAITRVAAAVAAAFSTRQIIAYADAFTNIQNKLRVVTGSTEELTQVTAQLLQVANDTRSSFDATADLFSKLTRSTEELNISQERLVAITTTINKSFAVAGASAQEASNAIRQLGQGLSAGALRGDEFNSVAEQAPGILRAVAAETGKTIGELREFAAQGGITAELLIRSVENYADTVEKEYAKTNRTFEQSTVVARNNAVAFIGANEQVQQAASLAGNAIVTLSENIETAGEVLLLITSVIAGRYLTAIGSAAAATIASGRAALVAKVQYDALGVAISRTTVVANAGAIAMRGLGASLAFLGGPLGVILLAASAFLIFSSNASDAKTITQDLIPVNQLLAQSYDDLTGAQIRNTRNILNERIAALKAEADAISEAGKLREGLNDAEASEFLQFIGSEAVADLGAAADSSQAKVDTLQQQVEKLNGRLKELADIESGRGKTVAPDAIVEPEDNSQSDDQQARIAKRLSDLRLETELTSSEYEIRRQVLNGFLLAEEGDIQISSERRLQKAISQRDLLLQEETITAEQRAETLRLFEEQRTQITLDAELARTDLARDQMLQRMQIEQQTQDTYLETAQIGIGALQNLIGGSSKAGKALKLIQAGVNAFQIYAASETAAALILATPPGPVLNPALIPLAASVSAKGKISAAAVLAAGASSAFSGGGGSGIGSFGGGGSAAPAPQPTTPTSAPLVGNLEIQGLSQLTDELRNYDGLLPASFVARILEQIPAANRLRGEDI